VPTVDFLSMSAALKSSLSHADLVHLCLLLCISLPKNECYAKYTTAKATKHTESVAGRTWHRCQHEEVHLSLSWQPHCLGRQTWLPLTHTVSSLLTTEPQGVQFNVIQCLSQDSKNLVSCGRHKHNGFDGDDGNKASITKILDIQ